MLRRGEPRISHVRFVPLTPVWSNFNTFFVGVEVQVFNSYCLIDRFECGKTDLLFSSSIGVWNLAFREAAKRRKRDMSSKHAAAIDSLVTHYGSSWYVAPELMKEALVAVFLTRMLTDARGVLEGSALEAATTVHRLMRAVRFNCHEVLDGFSVDDGSPPDRVGFALNPNLAMINHSCDPNIGRVWLNGADHVIGER